MKEQCVIIIQKVELKKKERNTSNFHYLKVHSSLMYLNGTPITVKILNIGTCMSEQTV